MAVDHLADPVLPISARSSSPVRGFSAPVSWHALQCTASPHAARPDGKRHVRRAASHRWQRRHTWSGRQPTTVYIQPRKPHTCPPHLRLVHEVRHVHALEAVAPGLPYAHTWGRTVCLTYGQQLYDMLSSHDALVLATGVSFPERAQRTASVAAVQPAGTVTPMTAPPSVPSGQSNVRQIVRVLP